MKIYGVIIGHENVSFAIDGFQCVFFNVNVNSGESEFVPCDQGFIWGQATGGRYVYIYSGQDIKFKEQMTLRTWFYFVSYEPDFKTYRAISFKGGILNKLFYKSALEFDYKGTAETSVKHQEDTKRYYLSNEKIEGEISVGTSVCRSMDVEKGSSISEDGTVLEILFDNDKKIQSFSSIYGYILSMCRFMAFRRNVRFDKIELIRSGSRFQEKAECHIYYDTTDDINKSIFQCLTFNELGECIDKLLDSIVNNKPKKPQFSIGFIPENDKDVSHITSMKVREVCSALESEMELAKIKVQQEQEFNELINKLKAVVKEHRDGDKPMTDEKLYDYILGSLNHLSGALADRIELCLIEYQHLIGDWINREQIDGIVKYRNTITHGNFMQMNSDLADTTYILMKLVYCCILKRIGMEDKLIKELFGRNIIS